MRSGPSARKGSSAPPTGPSPSPGNRGSAERPSGRGNGFQDVPTASNPSWSSLTSSDCRDGRQATPAPPRSQEQTTTCCGRMHKKHNMSGKGSYFQQLTRLCRLRAASVFPPWFHRLSATSRQEFHSLLHRAVFTECSAIPQISREVCT